MESTSKEFEFPDEKSAIAAAAAVSADILKGFGRARASIKTHKNLVLLEVVAKDRQALNASLNSTARLLEMCRQIVSEEKKWQK